MPTVGTTTLKANGRIRLPNNVLQSAGMAEGDEVLAVADGIGRVILAHTQTVTDALSVTPPSDVEPKQSKARNRESEEKLGEELLRKLGIS